MCLYLAPKRRRVLNSYEKLLLRRFLSEEKTQSNRFIRNASLFGTHSLCSLFDCCYSWRMETFYALDKMLLIAIGGLSENSSPFAGYVCFDLSLYYKMYLWKSNIVNQLICRFRKKFRRCLYFCKLAILRSTISYKHLNALCKKTQRDKSHRQ